jgi:hypothetical protein
VNLEKVVFGFFVLLAATLNFGFFLGDIDDPSLHNVYELFAAVVVNLVATVLKFGDRTQIGRSTSRPACRRPPAHRRGGHVRRRERVTGEGLSPAEMAAVVSLSGGALFANIVSVVLLVVETVTYHRSK